MLATVINIVIRFGASLLASHCCFRCSCSNGTRSRPGAFACWLFVALMLVAGILIEIFSHSGVYMLPLPSSFLLSALACDACVICACGGASGPPGRLSAGAGMCCDLSCDGGNTGWS